MELKVCHFQWKIVVDTDPEMLAMLGLCLAGAASLPPAYLVNYYGKNHTVFTEFVMTNHIWVAGSCRFPIG